MTLGFLRWIAYALLVSAVLVLSITIPAFHKARTGRYYYLRRDALRRGTRLFKAFLVLLGVSILLFAVPSGFVLSF